MCQTQRPNLTPIRALVPRRPAPEHLAPQQFVPQIFCGPNPNEVVCCGAGRQWGKISGLQRSVARCSGAGRRPLKVKRALEGPAWVVKFKYCIYKN